MILFVPLKVYRILNLQALYSLSNGQVVNNVHFISTFSIHININVRNIDIYLGTISYKDKCYKSERIRSVLRQLQPFCVRGVNFNNLSTYSLRRLCAVIHVRAAHFSKYPKIYNSIYIIRRVKQEQKKSSQFLLRCFGLRFFAPRQKLDRTKLFILTLYA